ncbi:MAG: nucleotidyl transferase AbiEii/AbiGii toxin family protein [Nitrospira sp.]|nr:nucleotidyl transferase AbiEii/AbiGii toxin family protein [bacterium]MBL7049078.1 nucleotidyl transferase AbiEii/AbiGii toxin family protein [Nitrospira sp.]
MHSAIEEMLKTYSCKTVDDYKNALKEILQEIALLGLFRANFFDKAAFYGGSALRIFYGLDRFSEDLDFSLLKPSDRFDIAPYCEFIREELAAFGFDATVTKKMKSAQSTIESAFIKAETLIHILQIESISPPISGVAENELLKIKLEIDTNPPAGAEYEIKYLLRPVPCHVRLFSDSSLFAGKIHALLCRNWGGGLIKGRDLYDYVWYISRSTPLSILHLSERMKQTGHLKKNENLNYEDLKKMLEKKFTSIDYAQAKQDIMPFIKDPQILNLWSADFFSTITRDKLIHIVG